MKINWEAGIDMTRAAYWGMAVMALICSGVSSGWAQQYLLYSPKAVNSGQPVDKKDGILVQELQVQRGDTLYGISRKFSGHGAYYPQIILFNDMKNPHKIYPGNVIKVPVGKQASHPEAPQSAAPGKPASGKSASMELSTAQLKNSNAASKNKRLSKKKSDAKIAVSRQKRLSAEAPPKRRHTEPRILQAQPSPPPWTSSSASPTSSQKLFEQGVKAYRQENYQTAIDLFDRFLSDNPSSPLAPDASFYKAECYLKQASR